MRTYPDMSFDDMEDCTNKTVLVSAIDIQAYEAITRPALALQHQGCAELVPLYGRQSLGRPTCFSAPDIPVNMPFVSRKHGLFQTDGMRVTYTALSGTNGTHYRGRRLSASERIELKDGDSLQIYADREKKNDTDVVIECAFSRDSQKSWNEIIKNQYDALTGLMSRKQFAHWFENHGVLEVGKTACFFVLDVDRFKTINDTYGHQNGDLALITLAKTLESVLGAHGKTGRWGGDEFVGIVFENREETAALMNAVRDKLSTIRVKELFSVGISVGLVEMHARESVDLTALFSHADAALYKAKREGRNRSVFAQR